MYRYRSRALLLAVAILAMGACSNNALTTATPTTSPCPCTDGFAGTLSANGAFTHTFTITTLGSVSAAIVSLAPNSSQIVGFGLGVWNGTSCTVASSTDIATTGSSITLNASSAGTLCVRLYDVGFITTPVLYQLQVVHP
jgi:ABC-type Fe3+-hydroxamate transport system substrate-binding protein